MGILRAGAWALAAFLAGVPAGGGPRDVSAAESSQCLPPDGRRPPATSLAVPLGIPDGRAHFHKRPAACAGVPCGWREDRYLVPGDFTQSTATGPVNGFWCVEYRGRTGRRSVGWISAEELVRVPEFSSYYMGAAEMREVARELESFAARLSPSRRWQGRWKASCCARPSTINLRAAGAETLLTAVVPGTVQSSDDPDGAVFEQRLVVKGAFAASLGDENCGSTLLLFNNALRVEASDHSCFGSGDGGHPGIGGLVYFPDRR